MRKLNKCFCLLAAGIILTVGSGFAQTGTVRGFVYDKSNGEPVIFTNVILEGTTHGISTDVNGLYQISKVPPGNYMLLVSHLSYDTLRFKIIVQKDKILSKTLYMSKRSVMLIETTISAHQQAKRTKVLVSVEKITPAEIAHIPSVGGEPDIAQYLQILPGVIFTGDQGGQLYIRGGTPIQNLVLLDGMVIYNPFHSIGLFSVFDTDILRNVDVYTGGFPADYGGRISSVMDITTRDGNKKRYAGKITAGTFSSKALIEGPIKKQTDDGKGSSSFIFSVKNSYLDESSKYLYTYIDTGGLPYSFRDLYGKMSMNGEGGSKLNMFGFHFSDQVNYQFVSDLKWEAWGFGSNFLLVPSASPTIISGNFSYSKYDISLAESDALPRESAINGFNMGLDFTYYLGKDELKYGLEILGFRTEFDFRNPVGRRIEQSENTTELAAYFRYKLGTDKFLFEPSFRAHFFPSLANFSPEPRLGAKYIVNDKLRIKFAGGLYAQNLISATSDRDVVNLFYGFLSGPDNLQDYFDGQQVTHKLQKASHAIVGFEYDIAPHLDLNVEAYYKKFTQLTNINRNKIYDDNGDNFERPDYVKKDFIIEQGDARGLDFLLKYDFKKLYLWAVYSLGIVERFDGIQTYNTHFDRRHNVNLVCSYTFGKDLNWEFNTRWNLGSGFPFTQTQGFFTKLTFQDGINSNYTTANGDLGIVYGDLNGGRLSYYHRLDMTVKRKFFIGDHSELEALFSITNIYDRENIFYFNRVLYERVNQLPVMPSFGMNMTF